MKFFAYTVEDASLGYYTWPQGRQSPSRCKKGGAGVRAAFGWRKKKEEEKKSSRRSLV